MINLKFFVALFAFYFLFKMYESFFCHLLILQDLFCDVKFNIFTLSLTLVISHFLYVSAAAAVHYDLYNSFAVYLIPFLVLYRVFCLGCWHNLCLNKMQCIFSQLLILKLIGIASLVQCAVFILWYLLVYVHCTTIHQLPLHYMYFITELFSFSVF